MKNWLRRVPGLVPLSRAVRTAVDPVKRHFWIARVLRREPAFQPSPHTQADRYPVQFAWVAQALADVAQPRVLSFGCSTGEELHSLRHYLPAARIKGIDINQANVDIAQASLSARPDPEICIQRAGSARGEPRGHYDAVFAMAVLRHGTLDALEPDECSAFLQFASFEAVVTDLVACLRPGGFLSVSFAHFRVEDCAVAADLERVWDNGPLPTVAPVYGRDNRRLPQQPYNQAIFRRKGTAHH